jgi:hypothetical protein
MSGLARIITVIIAAAAGAGVAVWLTRAPEEAAKGPEERPKAEAAGPKITMFYASPAVVEKGEPALLCYGVAQAERVRLEPPAAAVSPSPSRCVEVTPAAATVYTLTAEGAGGAAVSETIEVRVAAGAKPAAAPKPAPGAPAPARIEYFRVEEKKRDGALTVYKLCFQVWDAERVEVEPEAFPASRVFQGCFAAAPERRTVYRLKARGKDGGAVTKELTLEP